MNLKTLFSISLTTLLAGILSTVFIFSFKITQEFIENQVYSTSQDTVYSLGLSLASIDESNATTDMELMINAIFDSGYYEYIRLYDTDGRLLIEATLPVVVKNVPAWFIDLVPIHLKEAQGDVNRGWSKFGSLSVKGHAGYAYYELWKSFKTFLLIFGIIALLSVVILIFIINTLLRSLRGIKEQADAINKHKFIIEERSPFISEFDVLTKAMNQMVKKVEGIFQSEVRNFQNYQYLLYKDEETTLPNKKYFMQKLREILEHDDHKSVIGNIAIISIDGLADIKQEKSYAEYKDALLAIIATINRELNPQTLLARIGESELAILFDANGLTNSAECLTRINATFSATEKALKIREKLLCFHTGVVPFAKDDRLSQILSRADYALNQSRTKGCNSINVYTESTQDGALADLGKHAWRNKLQAIFGERRIALALQPVLKEENGALFHHEALLRIKESETSYQTAGFYLPMAYSLGLIPQFDRHVMELVLSNIHNAPAAVAVNLSQEFITHSHFFQGLSHQLSRLELKYRFMLHFECNESDIYRELETYIGFSEMVHANHQMFGIDRFTGLEDIGYIERLRPHYIKIPASFIEESHKNNRPVLNALNNLTHAMGITIIITAVQTREQLEHLKTLGYQFFQGIYISEPKIDTSFK